MSYLRKHINPALILSIVAVFIALGGGAYAAISANSVGSKQLKKNAVTAKKIKKNAVTTAKIKNDAVTGAKVKESSLGAVPLATNASSADNAKKVDGYRTFKQTTIGATSGPSFAAATAAAPEQTLFTAGPSRSMRNAPPIQRVRPPISASTSRRVRTVSRLTRTTTSSMATRISSTPTPPRPIA